jgi:peptidoglycan/xylan/chitin deacetylase (PgdA/CDA1 family)
MESVCGEIKEGIGERIPISRIAKGEYLPVKEVDQQVGYFVFSLDTELAWGSLNWDKPHPHPLRRDGATERATIQRLLSMMDEFGVVATWAITGHLFYEKCEECDICPILHLKGKDNRFEKIWGSRDTMWYGADIVESLLSKDSKHEIAFHGYTHRLFSKLGNEEARLEIQEWLRLAKRKNIIPKTVIFPQGKIGHLDLFREAGFICYRGLDVRHPALSIPILGKVLNRINQKFIILTPQVYEVKADSNSLVNVPSSQWLFRYNRRIEIFLDSLNLHKLRFQPTIKAINKAAEEKKVIHLWAHPHEFRTEKDFEKLRYLFGCFAAQANKGRLKSITMVDLAKQALKTNSIEFAHTSESRI